MLSSYGAPEPVSECRRLWGDNWSWKSRIFFETPPEVVLGHFYIIDEGYWRTHRGFLTATEKFCYGGANMEKVDEHWTITGYGDIAARFITRIASVYPQPTAEEIAHSKELDWVKQWHTSQR